jgi:threonine dehydratase
MIAPEAVLEAYSQVAGIAHRTPVLTSQYLDNQTGCQVFFKCENFQRVGAFKFRGAYNAISRLTEGEKGAGVITHSSGNHAQGVALAARLLGVKAVVVMPEDAPPNKREATEGYGAQIVPCDAFYREEVTARLIEERGFVLIHPFDNDHIIAGQGTAAYELFEEVGPLDYLFVPVGGGGLISGCALAARLLSPECRVIGVEPEVGADAGRSWRSGEIFKLDAVPQTIADGLRTRAIGHRNIEIMRRYVADMTTASEEEIYSALQFVWSRMKIVIEPSSAVALAPLLSGRYPVEAGARVGILLSGGNIDVSTSELVTRPTQSEPPSPSNNKTDRQSAARASQPPRILLCAPLEKEALEVLEAAGEVDEASNADEEALISQIGEYQALVVGPGQRVNSHVIKYGYNLKALGVLDSNLDSIDVSAARALGIEVCFAPDSRAVAIAEHTVRRLLALASRFADDRLAGKTLGLIGFGLVGRQVAQRAAAFDMRLLVNQPRLTPELALDPGVESTDLVELLRQSDFISLHVPFSQETETIIAVEELRYMKPTATIINMGHTDLIDEAALLRALEEGQIAGAALSMLPPVIAEPSPDSVALRRHPRVIVEPHVSAVIDDQRRDASLAVARQVANAVLARRANETLDLEVVPIELVAPHEYIDQKRVNRLMERFEEDGRLVNPPITTYWKGRYVILDGATRYSSLQRLNYPHIIVQVVDKDQAGFQLHTWYHAISAEEGVSLENAFDELVALLEKIDGLALSPLSPDETQSALQRPRALCYLSNRQGRLTLAEFAPGASKLTVMNAIVDTYNAWGIVERTLLTDTDRLAAQFPRLVAVAVFPQFSPEDVFDAAAVGDLLPAGLTRFVIPGRILRLNADLERLKRDEPLAAKRAWFNDFLAGKLARSRLRVYQEPVTLLDE